jgi:uncharacterized membrane protein
MAKIAVTEERLLHVEAEPAEAYAFFSQPEKLRAAMVGLERCEIDPSGRVRWVLEEKSGQGVRFQANFVVDYAGDGAEHVSWRFVEGNMENEGDVFIAPSPSGGSEIRYRERVAPDLPITPLLAKLVTPLVAKELKGDLTRFLERVQAALAN